MDSKPPYTHILKNLFHEQAREIIPLLWPEFQVQDFIDIEMPDLEEISTERPPNDLEKGIAGLVLPGAEVLQVHRTRWIEHSGVFERVYRAQKVGEEHPYYLLIEVQTELDGNHTARHLAANFASVLRYVEEELEPEKRSAANKQNRITYVYPIVLCPFAQAVPAPIRDEFQGELMFAFNFPVLCLWEKDAREFLNMRASSLYFLLPAMKNADAALLKLAIDELAQRFQGDEKALGRHLTGLNLLLQHTESMPAEEKLAAQAHLKPFARLLLADPAKDV